MKKLVPGLVAIAVLSFISFSAQAVTVDLTGGIGASGTINGAIYRVDDPTGPAGSGVLNSFVRVNPGGSATVEQGYNTSGRPAPFDDNSSPTFTHNLTIGDLPTVNVAGTNYYQFLLDINESQGNGDQFLSLDEVAIFKSATGSQTTTTLASLGTKVYDMDMSADSVVLLDSSKAVIGSGSGLADMTLLVPVSAFGTTTTGTFVYLYSHFGSGPIDNVMMKKKDPPPVEPNYGASDGYEEWATGNGVPFVPPVVPEPLTMLLIGSSLAAAGLKLRKRVA